MALPALEDDITTMTLPETSGEQVVVPRPDEVGFIIVVARHNMVSVNDVIPSLNNYTSAAIQITVDGN